MVHFSPDKFFQRGQLGWFINYLQSINIKHILDVFGYISFSNYNLSIEY
jgi:hypothetical protein